MTEQEQNEAYARMMRAYALYAARRIVADAESVELANYDVERTRLEKLRNELAWQKWREKLSEVQLEKERADRESKWQNDLAMYHQGLMTFRELALEYNLSPNKLTRLLNQSQDQD